MSHMSSTRNNQAKTEDKINKINMSGIWLPFSLSWPPHPVHASLLGHFTWRGARIIRLNTTPSSPYRTAAIFSGSQFIVHFFSHTQTPKPLQRAFAFFEILSFLEDTNCISSTDLIFECFLECFVVLPNFLSSNSPLEVCLLSTHKTSGTMVKMLIELVGS